jgi:acetyltransferase EpsM
MKSVLIIGAGGHAQDVIDVACSAGYSIAGFLDDNITGDFILGKVKDYRSIIDKYRNQDIGYVIGINNSKTREYIDEVLTEIGAKPITLVHSSAVIGHNVEIGLGSVLGAGVVLTSNVSIGRHVHMNTHASVNQGSTIGDYCTLSPGVKVCGDVTAGKSVQFGASSTVINLINIGDNVILGAGAVVVNDIPSDVTAKGVPARY